jgi:hypothetical protein
MFEFTIAHSVLSFNTGRDVSKKWTFGRNKGKRMRESEKTLDVIDGQIYSIPRERSGWGVLFLLSISSFRLGGFFFSS